MAASAAVPKVLSPSSPFGELLRRSHFASFDPKIRQTYTAPASYISRGNWGLKRPIANRNRHGEIVLKKFEEHEMFIEWDRASTQVALVKRVEELNIRPTLAHGTPWAMSLDPGAGVMDSEFAPEELQREERERKALHAAERKKLESAAAAKRVAMFPGAHSASAFPATADDGLTQANATLDSIVSRGKGAYGMRPKPVDVAVDGESVVQPNLAAMSPKRFKQYLDELADLRPRFLAYIREELAKNSKHDVQALSDEDLVTTLGAEAITRQLHRFFLGEYAQSKFANSKSAESNDSVNTPRPIRGRPHKHAGLMYASPTNLETFFSTQYEPGIVLQEGLPGGAKHVYTPGRQQYIAAFAGLSASVDKTDVPPGTRPLLEPYTNEGIQQSAGGEDGVDTHSLAHSERRMRMVNLVLESPPLVVGVYASNRPITTIELGSTVVVEGNHNHVRTNSSTPGSLEYNGAEPEGNLRGSIPYSLPGMSKFSVKSLLKPWYK